MNILNNLLFLLTSFCFDDRISEPYISGDTLFSHLVKILNDFKLKKKQFFNIYT